MRSQHLLEAKALFLVLLLLLNEFLDQLLQSGLFVLRNKWLLEKDLLNEAVDISSIETKDWLESKKAGVYKKANLLECFGKELSELILSTKQYLLEGEVQQIDGFGFDFAARAQVLQDNTRWVISQQKSLELHFEKLFM